MSAYVSFSFGGILENTIDMDCSDDDDISSKRISKAFHQKLIKRSPIRTRSGNCPNATDTRNININVAHFRRSLADQLKKTRKAQSVKKSDNIDLQPNDTNDVKYPPSKRCIRCFRKLGKVAEADSDSSPPKLVTPSRWLYETPKIRRPYRFPTPGESVFESALYEQNESGKWSLQQVFDNDSGTISANCDDDGLREDAQDAELFNDSAASFEEFSLLYGIPDGATSTPIKEDQQEQIAMDVVEANSPIKEDKINKSQTPTEDNDCDCSECKSEEYKWYDDELDEIRKCFLDVSFMDETASPAESDTKTQFEDIATPTLKRCICYNTD